MIDPKAPMAVNPAGTPGHQFPFQAAEFKVVAMHVDHHDKVCLQVVWNGYTYGVGFPLAELGQGALAEIRTADDMLIYLFTQLIRTAPRNTKPPGDL